MEAILLLVMAFALAAAFLLQRKGRAEQLVAGLPVDARVIYADTGAWERVEKPLFARRYRLTGKPDYIVTDDAGATIPIEVKPNRSAAAPRLSDTMQLMAYGVLIEEKFRVRPAYGLLKYSDRVFRIEFSDELRAELLQILEDMRRARGMSSVARSHDDVSRCRYCGYRDACEERLE